MHIRVYVINYNYRMYDNVMPTHGTHPLWVTHPRSESVHTFYTYMLCMNYNVYDNVHTYGPRSKPRNLTLVHIIIIIIHVYHNIIILWVCAVKHITTDEIIITVIIILLLYHYTHSNNHPRDGGMIKFKRYTRASTPTHTHTNMRERSHIK